MLIFSQGRLRNIYALEFLRKQVSSLFFIYLRAPMFLELISLCEVRRYRMKKKVRKIFKIISCKTRFKVILCGKTHMATSKSWYRLLLLKKYELRKCFAKNNPYLQFCPPKLKKGHIMNNVKLRFKAVFKIKLYFSLL